MITKGQIGHWMDPKYKTITVPIIKSSDNEYYWAPSFVQVANMSTSLWNTISPLAAAKLKHALDRALSAYVRSLDEDTDESRLPLLLGLHLALTRDLYPLGLDCLADSPIGHDSSDVWQYIHSPSCQAPPTLSPVVPCSIASSPPELDATDKKSFSQNLLFLAQKVTCASNVPLQFQTISCPHFCGGRDLFERTMKNLGWISVENRQILPTSKMVIAPCMMLLPSMSLWKESDVPNRLLSSAPNERNLVVKRPFVRSVMRRFAANKCDFTELIPETYFVSVKDGCEAFLRRLDEVSLFIFLYVQKP